MPREQINLLPESEVKQVQVNPYVSWFFRVGVYFLIITYILVLVAYGFRWYQEKSLADLNSSISSKKQQYDESKNFLEEYKSMQDRYGVVAGVIDTYKPKLKYLELIEKSVPEPIRIKKIDLISADTSLTIEGFSADYLAVRQWQSDLTKDELIATVDLKGIERVKQTDANLVTDGSDGQIRFTFNIKLK